jgi:TctA family transporter
MALSRGDPTTFITRPTSATLLLVGLLLLGAVILPNVRRRRDDAFRDAQ